MDFSFDLTGICAMSPALPDTVSFLSWAEGDGAFPVKEGRVKSPLVPGMLSRRLLPETSSRSRRCSRWSASRGFRMPRCSRA